MSGFDSSKFSGGSSYLVSDDAFKAFCYKRANLGRADEANGNLFCVPSDQLDKAIVDSNGDVSALEKQLGLEEGTYGNGPLHRVDVENPSEHNLRAATGEESGANCYFNTPVDENGNLPDIKFCTETDENGKTYTARDAEGREIIDGDKTDPSEIEKLNGKYAVNYGELEKDENDHNIPNGDIKDANLQGYDNKTSGGLDEGVMDRVPNTQENVNHTTIDGWKRGEKGELTSKENKDAYKPDDNLEELKPKQEENNKSETMAKEADKKEEPDKQNGTEKKESMPKEAGKKEGTEKQQGTEKKESMPKEAGKKEDTEKQQGTEKKESMPKEADKKEGTEKQQGTEKKESMPKEADKKEGTEKQQGTDKKESMPKTTNKTNDGKTSQDEPTSKKDKGTDEAKPSNKESKGPSKEGTSKDGPSMNNGIKM